MHALYFLDSAAPVGRQQKLYVVSVSGARATKSCVHAYHRTRVDAQRENVHMQVGTSAHSLSLVSVLWYTLVAQSRRTYTHLMAVALELHGIKHHLRHVVLVHTPVRF